MRRHPLRYLGKARHFLRFGLSFQAGGCSLNRATSGVSKTRATLEGKIKLSRIYPAGWSGSRGRYKYGTITHHPWIVVFVLRHQGHALNRIVIGIVSSSPGSTN